MKRSLAWLTGIVGIAALGRLLSKRNATPPPDELPHPAGAITDPLASDNAADPAEELRRTLAAKREPTTPPEEEAVETLETRRARVHAKAREAMDAMNDDGPAA